MSTKLCDWCDEPATWEAVHNPHGHIDQACDVHKVEYMDDLDQYDGCYKVSPYRIG